MICRERKSTAARRGLSRLAAGLAVICGLLLSTLAMAPPAAAASGLNIFVGYMDTHSVAFSSSQPNPWPYTDPSSFIGWSCSNYGTSTQCWDAPAVRLDNPGNSDVTGVTVQVIVDTHVYNPWGSFSIAAHGMKVLTDTQAYPASNFDLSDFAPNDYHSGGPASCVNNGVIPIVRVTINGVSTDYTDAAQILNGGGADSGHCVNGSYVSGRIDESQQWVEIPTPPQVPQNLTATRGPASVLLSWSPPVSDGGATITGYNIYRSTSSGTETLVWSGVGGTSFTDANRTNGTTYFYVVSAVNSAGESSVSNEAFATPSAPPSTPQNLTATRGNGQVQLSWSPPAANNGAPVTGYKVYRSTTTNTETFLVSLGNVTTYTDTPVTNGTQYFYKVTALNLAGESVLSGEASAIPSTVASAPQSLTATPGNAQVQLSWMAPASNGGANVTSYNVYRGTATGTETLSSPGVVGTSFTDTTVMNGTKYFYKVTAVNVAGESPLSNEASATPVSTVPPAPTGLTGQGVSSSQVQLGWNASSGASSYSVQRSSDGVSFSTVASGVSATSYLDGQFLRLNGGVSSVSAPSSSALAITGDIDVRVRMAFDSWAPGDYEVVVAKDTGASRSYSLYVQPSGVFSFLWSPDGTGANVRVVSSSAATGFAAGSMHWVRVTRSAATGVAVFYTSSDGVNWSQLGSTVFGPAGSMFAGSQSLAVGSLGPGGGYFVSGGIYNLEVRNGIGGTIVANPDFTTASGPGFSDGSGNSWSVSGVGASLLGGPPLAANTTYTYRVVAVGPGGSSAPSATATATTLSPVPAPPAPTGLTGQGVSSSQVQLGWNASSGASSYSVQRSSDGVSFSTVASGVSATSYLDGQFLRLNGGVSSVSAPSSSALAITGDIDVRVRMAFDSWAPGDYEVVVAKDTGASRSYSLYVQPSGVFSFLWSPDGTGANVRVVSSSAATGFAAGSMHWVRVTRSAATGVAVFYTSSDGVNWSQLGSTVFGPAGSMFAGSQSLAVGSLGPGGGYFVSGGIYNLEVRNGIGGTIVANPDFTTASGPGFSDGSGNSWSVSGVGASLLGGPPLAANTTYTYRVVAVGPGGSSAPSATATATTLSPVPAPPAPTGLTGQGVSSSQVQLGWNASSGASSYSVQRSSDGVSFSTVASGVSATSYLDGQFLRLNGGVSSVSAPSSSALAITGDIDVRVRMAFDSWAPGDYEVVVAKDTGASRSYSLYVQPSGVFSFLWSPDGTGANVRVVSSSAATGFAAGSMHWVRVTRSAATGVAVFYTSSDGVNWSQLGSTVFGPAGSMFAGSQSLAVGSLGPGGGYFVSGGIYNLEVRNGIGGTIVANPDFTTASGPGFSDGSGNSWSVSGVGASLLGGPPLAANTTYTYRVVAVGPGGSSAPSATATATTLSPVPAPPAPTGLTGQGVSSSQVQLGWNASSGASSYSVQRSSDGVSFSTVASGVSATSYLDGQFLRLNGGVSSVSAPSSSALAITGDIDVRVRMAFDSWAPGDYEVVVAKDTGASRSYSLYVQPSGVFSFLWSPDGTGANVRVVSSSAATGFAAGSMHWVRVTRSAATGVAVFYTSSDGVNWSQLGSTVFGPAGSMFAGSQSLAVGSLGPGGGYFVSGGIYNLEVRNGIGGTIVANPDFTTASGPGFSDGSGNSWSVSGVGASLLGGPPLAANTTYTYRVVAVGPGGSSAPSATATGKTLS